jgi:hypothetical protein
MISFNTRVNSNLVSMQLSLCFVAASFLTRFQVVRTKVRNDIRSARVSRGGRASTGASKPSVLFTPVLVVFQYHKQYVVRKIIHNNNTQHPRHSSLEDCSTAADHSRNNTKADKEDNLHIIIIIICLLCGGFRLCAA